MVRRMYRAESGISSPDLRACLEGVGGYIAIMQRLGVCQLVTELRPAGAERCVYELAVRLDRRRFDVHVAALRGGAVADWLARAGVGVTVLNVRGKLDAARLPRLVGLLRRKRIRLLHTHLFHADLAGRIAARVAGVPHLVHTVHVAEGRFRPWQYAWARLTADWCDRIVCVSRAVRDHHARRARLPLRRYAVIHNGIDADAYARHRGRRQQLRRAWAVGPGEVLIAFVGRLDYQKNVALFLEASHRLRSLRRDVRIVIAGDGPDRAAVEEFLQSGDASRWSVWLGHSDDVAGLLSAADILVQPSRWEGFGLAAAEAMAAGLPVVATKVPGLSEVVDDGVTGWLVDSEDADALAAAMRRLVERPQERARLGAAGRQRVSEHFSIAANVAAHQRLYQELSDH